MDCSSCKTTPTSAIFLSGIWLPCGGGNENSSLGKPPHSYSINTCLLFIYPHQGPFPPLYRDHQSISYWPDTGSIWQCYWYLQILILFLNVFLSNSSTVVWDIWKSLWTYEGSNRCQDIHLDFKFFKRLSQWEHLCSTSTN